MTFTIPIIPIIIVSSITIIVIASRIIGKAILNSNLRLEQQEQNRKLEREKKAAEQSQAQLLEDLALFHVPWLEAYEGCRKLESMEGKTRWLRKWIGERIDLPLLKQAAALKLVRQLADQPTTIKRRTQREVERTQEDVEWERTWDIIAPYLDTGGDSGIEWTEEILKSLPKEWFDFWLDIKDYPSRRSLFWQKIGYSSSKSRHPACEVALSTDQATLLARALGGRDGTVIVESYASDLAQFVEMEGEIVSAKKTWKPYSKIEFDKYDSKIEFDKYDKIRYENMMNFW